MIHTRYVRAFRRKLFCKIYVMQQKNLGILQYWPFMSPTDCVCSGEYVSRYNDISLARYVYTICVFRGLYLDIHRCTGVSVFCTNVTSSPCSLYHFIHVICYIC